MSDASELSLAMESSVDLICSSMDLPLFKVMAVSGFLAVF